MRGFRAGSPRILAGGLLLVAAYFLAGKIGLGVEFENSSVSPVWPASGIAVAGLMVLGLRAWPAVLVGALLVNMDHTGHVASSALIAGGNAVEAIAGAWMAQSYAGGWKAFSKPRTLAFFVGGTGVLAPMIAATVGVGTLTLLDLAPLTSFPSLWTTWWLGDVGGILIVVPPCLLWARYGIHGGKPDVRREEIGMLVAAVAVGAVIFWVPWRAEMLLGLSPLLMLPPLAWAAYRLGPRAAATSLLLLDIIAVAATTMGKGPLALRTENESLLLLQVFLSVVSVSTLGLSVLPHLARNETRPERPHDDPALPASGGRLHASPSLVLFTLALLPILLATAAAGAVSRHVEAGLVEARFHGVQRGVADAFVDGLERHADRLYGTKGLFESSDEVTRLEFRTFVNVSEWQGTLAGLQGVAFVRYVRSNETEAFEERVRGDTSVRPGGFPAFAIQPPGNRSEYFVVEYIEPLDGNEGALGFDIGSEPFRRHAIQRAISSGQPAASGAVTLAQDMDDQKGILIVLPVYDGGDPGSSGNRSATLLGLVDAVHRLSDMMEALEADVERDGGPVRFELYDSPTLEPMEGSGERPMGALLYDSDEPPLTGDDLQGDRVGLLPVHAFGRTWTLAIERPGGLLTPAEASAPWFLLAAGAVLTLALVAFTHYQQDVWHRRDLSLALQQAQEMNEFKSNLLNTASHELNTPISALKLQIFLLNQMFPADELLKAKDSLALMDRNVNRLAALVGDTLDVARIQSGKLVIRPAEANLQPLLDDVVATYRPVAEKARVALALHAEPDVMAWADPSRLTQVLNNLVSNAVKFTPAGGHVDITLERADGQVVVAVRDTGLGMDLEQLGRLFQPFSQVHDTTAGKYRGTGLGLYISKSIVEQHGGRLWAESAGRGHGSTFRFTIPIRAA